MRWLNNLRNRPARDVAVALVFLGVFCLLIVSAAWAYREYMTTPPYVDKEKYPVRGIDISRHNGKIDFKKVAEDGMEFVFIKASEGRSHRDPMFEENLAAATQAGLKTGAYHFFRFDRGGVEQAINFLEAVGDKTTDLGLVIDVEQAGNPENIPVTQICQSLEAMVDYLHLSGQKVMIYTNIDGYYDYIAETLPGYPLWICRFRENPINTDWIFWQYDHHGKVAGIHGDVDLNAFNGSREEWENYLREPV